MKIFHYSPGNTVLHKHNSLFFFGELLLLSTLLFFLRGSVLIVYFVLIVLALFASKIELRELFKQIRFLLPLLLIIGVAAYFRTVNLPVMQRVYYVMQEVSRYLLFLLTGILFTYTRSSRQIYYLIARICQPIPLLPEKKIASFFLIVFFLIPSIFDIYQEVRDSVTSRRGYRPLHFIRSTVYTVYPLMVNSIIRTSTFSEALISRSFSTDRSVGLKEGITIFDCIIFVIVLIVALMMIMINSNIFNWVSTFTNYSDL